MAIFNILAIKYVYTFTILLIIFTIAAIAEKKKIVCIYQTGAHRRHGDGNFQVEHINPHLCTHLVYAYFGIDKDTDQFISKEKGFDLDVEENGSGNIKNFNLLKHENKNLLTIAGIGGWDSEQPSIRWSNIANNRNRRQAFIESSIKFIEKYRFNGIMLYWCFPGVNGDQSIDKKNFPILLKEFKFAFDKRGLVLGVAAHAIKNDADVSYDIPKISEYSDFIYLTGFDYYGFWLPEFTGISTALYSGKYAKDKDRNSDAAVSYWLQKGAAPEKLVLGVGLFGRTFTLKNENNTYPGAGHTGNGRAGAHTTEPGIMGYNEFCAIQMTSNKWTLKWDDEQKVPYAYKGNQWIGYENPKSIAIKAKYVNEKKLGGIGASFVEDDDFRGLCGQPYPLLNTMKSIVQTADSEDINYIINLSIFKKHSKYKHTQLVYHSSEGIEL